MRILNDFRCPNGHLHEYFVDSSENSVRCKECELEATKVVTTVNAVFNPFGKNPTTKAVLRWEKSRDRKAAQQAKTNQ